MFKIVLVTGNSMMPTLENGEQVLAWHPLTKRLFRRGVIVTLRHHNIRLTQQQRLDPCHLAVINATSPELFIKRIVGVAGDTVRIPVDQLPPYRLSQIDPQAVRQNDEFVWHVPENHIFVRGDNPHSGDSILWGPIPLAQVEQLVLCRFPSFGSIPPSPRLGSLSEYDTLLG